MSDWVSWAQQNLDLRGLLNWANDNVRPQDLQRLKEVAVKEVQAAVGRPQAPPQQPPPQLHQPAAPTQSWASWLSGATAPASAGAEASTSASQPVVPPATATTTPPARLAERALKLAVRNWKVSLPVAVWVFGWLLSWFWWVALLAGIVFVFRLRASKLHQA